MTEQEYIQLRKRTLDAEELLCLLAHDLVTAYEEDAATGGPRHYHWRVTLWASYRHVRKALRYIQSAVAS
jgi:hypothetical protein